jgi:hypothetical protein
MMIGVNHESGPRESRSFQVRGHIKVRPGRRAVTVSHRIGIAAGVGTAPRRWASELARVSQGTLSLAAVGTSVVHTVTVGPAVCATVHMAPISFRAVSTSMLAPCREDPPPWPEGRRKLARKGRECTCRPSPLALDVDGSMMNS